MAGFTGGALHTLPDASLEDDAEADAGAESEHAQRIDGEGLAGAEEEFAISGEIRVGVYLDWEMDAALEFGAEVEPIEAGKIRRMVQHAERQFKGARTANANTERLHRATPSYESSDGGSHVVENGVRSVGEPGRKADGISRSPSGVTAAMRRLVPPRSMPME